MRICTKCKNKKELILENFRFRKSENRWFRICRECERENHRKYLIKTNYYQNNKKEINKKNKENYYKNIEDRTSYNKKYYVENRNKVLKSVKKYVEKNKKSVREYQNKYKSKRRKNDPAFKLKENVRKQVNYYIKKFNSFKNSSVWSVLPYSPQELRSHIESQFEPWMSWDNHGSFSKNKKTWQIDHIMPQSKLPYDSLDHPNFKKCWALENLRPLEAYKNLKKGNKVLK